MLIAAGRFQVFNVCYGFYCFGRGLLLSVAAAVLFSYLLVVFGCMYWFLRFLLDGLLIGWMAD